MLSDGWRKQWEHRGNNVNLSMIEGSRKRQERVKERADKRWTETRAESDVEQDLLQRK